MSAPAFVLTTDGSSDANVYSRVTTINQLLVNVPVHYRELLRRELLLVHDVAVKALRARQALLSFQKHETLGTYPPAINSLKAPIVQCSQEFLAESIATETLGKLGATTVEAKKVALKTFIEAKSEECKFLTGRISTATVSPKIKNLIDKAFEELKLVLGDTPSKIVVEQYQNLKAEVSFMVVHVTNIAFNEQQVQIGRKVKNLSIRQKADVEMVDASSTTLAAAIDAALRKRDAEQKNSRKRKGMLPSSDSPLLSNALSCKKQKTSPSEPRSSLRPWQGEEEEEELVVYSRRQGYREKVQAEVTSMLDETPPFFNKRRTNTYPPSFFRVSDRARVIFQILNSSVEELDTRRRFSPGVHKGPDVLLAQDIEYKLALNLKFCFHSRISSEQPIVGYNSLIRQVRIIWAFRNKAEGDYNRKLPYLKSDWVPPRAAPHIELGLHLGRQELFRQLPFIDDDEDRKFNVASINPNVSTLLEYLQVNKYLVCASDKNLGVAVIHLSWYRDVMLKHLNTTGVYVTVPEDEGHAWVYEKVTKYYNFYKYLIPTQLQKYVEYHLQRNSYKLPAFYGIPKIHKNPWKIRPIVPSHSWYTTELAQYVTSLLQPLLALFPWVIHSSRDFVNLVTNASQGTGKRWLCTGDVTSMYTSIPRKSLYLRLIKLIRENPTLVDPNYINLIVDGINIINKSAYFTYDRRFYNQRRGIAMGISCSPVLANLYMAIDEKRYHSCFDLYARYIDDIFCLTDEAHDTVLVQATGLEINWNKSQMRLEFLDTEVIQYPDYSLHFRLWRKPLNHFQYLPWSSSHALAVKRSLVKGELTRINTNSSKQEFFDEASKDFWHHLVARGYPVRVLRSWFKMVQWSRNQKTIRQTPESTPLMLPGTYNPIWSYISVEKIREALLEGWTTGNEIPDSLINSRVIKVLSRPVNLGSFAKKSNRMLLATDDYELITNEDEDVQC